jgi:prepilin-type processing-associated H-X9-DG protein
VTLDPERKCQADITNGNGTSQVVTAWEHADGPQCWSVHNRTWNPVEKDDPPMHYPLWHAPVCHFLFCDGHVGRPGASGNHEAFVLPVYVTRVTRP